MYYQNQDGMPDSLQHNGCYFMSLLYPRFGELTQQQIIALWNQAHTLSFINIKDVIVDPQWLVDFLKLGLHYVDQHFDPDTPVPPNTYVVEQWFNPDTRFFHFMKGDGLGNIEYDPIEGGSLTHRDGHLYSMRFYNET
jgi:hypothetical protein